MSKKEAHANEKARQLQALRGLLVKAGTILRQDVMRRAKAELGMDGRLTGVRLLDLDQAGEVQLEGELGPKQMVRLTQLGVEEHAALQNAVTWPTAAEVRAQALGWLEKETEIGDEDLVARLARRFMVSTESIQTLLRAEGGLFEEPRIQTGAGRWRLQNVAPPTRTAEELLGPQQGYVAVVGEIRESGSSTESQDWRIDVAAATGSAPDLETVRGKAAQWVLSQGERGVKKPALVKWLKDAGLSLDEAKQNADRLVDDGMLAMGEDGRLRPAEAPPEAAAGAPSDPQEKVPLATAVADVAPSIVENPEALPKSEAGAAAERLREVLYDPAAEDRADIAQLRKESKAFVELGRLRRRQKSIEAEMREHREELKQLKEDLIGVNTAIDEILEHPERAPSMVEPKQEGPKPGALPFVPALESPVAPEVRLPVPPHTQDNPQPFATEDLPLPFPAEPHDPAQDQPDAATDVQPTVPAGVEDSEPPAAAQSRRGAPAGEVPLDAATLRRQLLRDLVLERMPAFERTLEEQLEETALASVAEVQLALVELQEQGLIQPDPLVAGAWERITVASAAA